MINVEREIGGRVLKFQTGKVARQSAGSVIVTYGETVILVAVNSAKEPRTDINYFPLQVEYREKHYAGGKIPGGFFKREARPSEGEVLTSRLTDRPIRPLFPKGFKNETQVIINVLQSDGENMPDVWAGVGASLALMISNIPWHGPLATVRVGQIDGEFILNPTRSQIDNCDLELIVSGNDGTIVMVEGEANEQSEKTVVESLKFAHEHIRNIIDLEKELFDAVQVEKLPEPEADLNSELEAAVGGKLGSKINDIISIKEKQGQSDSKEELKKRLTNRATDSSDQIELRFQEAIKDIEQYSNFDRVIVNNDIDSTCEEIMSFVNNLHTSEPAVNKEALAVIKSFI